MKNGTVKIEIFEALDSIYKKYKKDFNITYESWADAAWGDKSKQSRISELRRKARLRREGYEDAIGRAFSFQKCTALLNGLMKIIGRDLMSKELIKLLDKAKSSKERMLLLVMAMDEPDEAHSEMYLKRVVLKEHDK